LLSINLTEKLDKYEDNLKRITNFNKGDREARLTQCKELETDIMEIRQRYICELRQLSSGPERKNFVEDLKKQMDRYSKLLKLYDERANAINPEDLENIEVSAPVIEENVTPEQAFARATALGDGLQDKTEGVIHGMQDDVLDAEEIANQTNLKMENQLDQIGRINQGYDELGEATGKSRKQTDAIKKAFTRDKFIIGLTVANVVLFIAIMSCYIFWHPTTIVNLTTDAGGEIEAEADIYNMRARLDSQQHALNLIKSQLKEEQKAMKELENVSDAKLKELEMNLVKEIENKANEIKASEDAIEKYALDIESMADDAPSGVVSRYPGYIEGEFRGIDEGLEYWIQCLGSEPEHWLQWNVSNKLLPYSIRGPAFGIVDFSNFYLDDDGQYVCDQTSFNYREAWGGWRNLTRNALNIDWK